MWIRPVYIDGLIIRSSPPNFCAHKKTLSSELQYTIFKKLSSHHSKQKAQLGYLPEIWDAKKKATCCEL